MNPGISFTGWAFTDAVAHMRCPRCGSDPGERCKTPQKQEVHKPHTKRVKAFWAKYPDGGKMRLA